MAIPTTIIDRARHKLADPALFFSHELTGHGKQQAYQLPVINVDPETFTVSVNGATLSTGAYELIADDGFLRFVDPPALGDVIIVEGYWWAWFSDSKLSRYGGYVWDEMLQHETADNDEEDLEDLLDENPDLANVFAMAVLVEGLWSETMAAARQIETSSPEVSVHAQTRYSRLFPMLQMQQEELRKAQAYLNVGRYKIEMVNQRIVSRTTGRFVPLVKPREIDELDHPIERVLPPVDDGVILK